MRIALGYIQERSGVFAELHRTLLSEELRDKSCRKVQSMRCASVRRLCPPGLLASAMVDPIGMAATVSEAFLPGGTLPLQIAAFFRGRRSSG